MLDGVIRTSNLPKLILTERLLNEVIDISFYKTYFKVELQMINIYNSDSIKSKL